MEEVVVDAYGEEERAMGWYYYAADNIMFPFTARCSAKRAASPLKVGETGHSTALSLTCFLGEFSYKASG